MNPHGNSGKGKIDFWFKQAEDANNDPMAKERAMEVLAEWAPPRLAEYLRVFRTLVVWFGEAEEQARERFEEELRARALAARSEEVEG